MDTQTRTELLSALEEDQQAAEAAARACMTAFEEAQAAAREVGYALEEAGLKAIKAEKEADEAQRWAEEAETCRDDAEAVRDRAAATVNRLEEEGAGAGTMRRARAYLAKIEEALSDTKEREGYTEDAARQASAGAEYLEEVGRIWGAG